MTTATFTLSLNETRRSLNRSEQKLQWVSKFDGDDEGLDPALEFKLRNLLGIKIGLLALRFKLGTLDGLTSDGMGFPGVLVLVLCDCIPNSQSSKTSC